ncbi:MAG: hypothetical protein K8L91_07880 [Anaerolineae bacterium]|nr:MAG: hypothetical protein F9K46_03475 [Anaerolineae bacterium]MBZ0316321.1 hypothetical protein [Anaerolineae bacterium]
MKRQTRKLAGDWSVLNSAIRQTLYAQDVNKATLRRLLLLRWVTVSNNALVVTHDGRDEWRRLRRKHQPDNLHRRVGAMYEVAG